MSPGLTEVRRGHPAAAPKPPESADSLAVLFVPTAARERAAVKDRLARAGAAVSLAADVPEMMAILNAERHALVVLDLAAERTALAAIRLLRTEFPQLPIVGLIDPAYPLVAGEAIGAGVAGLLSWPFEEQEFEEIAANLRDRQARSRAVASADVDSLVASSTAMREVVETARSAAAAAASRVAVCGEPGTGRELVARLVHRAGTQDTGDRPFIVVDCSSDDSEGLERQLFGSTGDRRHDPSRGPQAERVGSSGAIVKAQGGTLYLTALINAPGRVQAKLARLLRDREAYVEDRRGAIDLSVRVIAAFEPDIDTAITDGRIRKDLFDRLSQMRIDVPALRRRREDLPGLVACLLAKAGTAHGVAPKALSRAALALLVALPWRGNGRELRDLMDVLVRSVPRRVIQLDDVLQHTTLDGASPRIDVGLTLRAARAQFERECIAATLIRHHGRVGEAAKALGLQRTNLYRKVRQLNVPRSLLSPRR